MDPGDCLSYEAGCKEIENGRTASPDDAILTAAADAERHYMEKFSEEESEVKEESPCHSAENDDESEEEEEEGDEEADSNGDLQTKEESHSSEHSPDLVIRRPPKKRKISEECLHLLEAADVLRRSGRTRKEVQRLNIGQVSDDEDEKTKRRQSSRHGKRSFKGRDSDSEDSSVSSESSGFNGVRRRQPQRKGFGRNRRKKKRAVDSSDEWSDSSSAPRRPARGGRDRIDYKESSSGGEIDSDDVLEWEEDLPSTSNLVSEVACETIEKVLKYRRGRPGAVGPSTTCYNVEEKGDPNDPPPSSIEDFEIQYLIKWVGWAHIHNTWESEETLKQASAKGMKKLENYINRVKEIEAWKKTADKDYIEYFDCEQEMNEELYEQYKQAERIIAMNRVKDKERGVEITDYFVKWLGLPYSESTWEDGGLISKRFQTVIDSFECRINSRRIPGKYSNALKKRPKFSHLKEQPYYVGKERGDRSFLLRDYQLDGLNWLLQAWCRWNSVILADEMGLGKTIQTISFLSVLIHEYEVYGPFLIVVPLSTIAAWQREFEQWDATINFIIYLGDVTSRDLIRQYEWYTLPQKRLKFNAVLTTYEILLKDKAFLGSFDWAVLMVDEAHRLKNDESLLYRALMDFRTYHRLLITGTPLQNSLKELWALLHFIMADKFDNWEAFEENHGGSDKKAYSSLHKELEPFLLRRVKKDVEKSLPAKVEQILRVDMTAIQKQYYKWILTKNYKALSKGVKGSISGFLNLMMELKKCCNHSFLVRQPDVDCTDPQERLQQIIKSSGKLILLDKLLIRLEQSGHRVLIFSQMVMLLDILQEYLRLRKFTFQRLDGSIRGDLRRQALDHFNNEGSTDFCFLLSTKAGGLGINLATADTVIIFDSDWNPQNDLQAQSRAHRIGQTRQVNIYRLVTKGSVEEDIVERAKKKLVLDHLVIQRMDTTGRTVLSKNAVTSAGSIHFDKQELAAILKFGAEDLFKEKEGEEQEPEVDIDDILQRAETREMDSQTSCGDELLGAFKYANFAFDEAEEIEMMPQTKNQGQVLDEKEWDEIIPEEERRKLEEEQRLQMEMELQLPPRQRNKIQQMARNEDSDEDWEKSRKKRKKGDDSESSESSDEERPSRIKRARKALLFSFSESEIRKFIKAFKKFAQPMSRLEAIACDAELEEHSSGELKQVAEALIRGCKQAVEEYAQQQKPQGEPDSKKRDRGPVCKLGPVEVAVRPLLRIQSDLEPLYCIMPGTAHERKHFVLPSKPKVLKNWDCEWDENDDAALLRGIYEYGMGSWDSIKMDPDLGLNEKIMLSDKNKKPQAKHIQSRADYLLKFLQKQKDQTGEDAYYRPKEDLDELINSVINNTLDSKETKVKKDKQETTGKKDKVLGEEKKKKEKAKVGESKKREVEEGELEGEKGTVVSSKKESKPKKTEKPLVTAKTDHLGVKNRYANDLADQNSPVFKECVQLMGPASRSMKRMSKSESEEDRNHYLLKVGDHIQECLVSKVKDEKVLEKWLSYLWIFVARFTTELDAAKWHRRYRDISHNRNKEREQESKEHRHENKEYKHHDHHHRQRHHHHKHNEKQASSTCQLHVPQLTDKQHHQTHHTKYHHHSQPSTSTARYGRTEEKFFTRNSDQIHATQEFQPKQLGDSGSPVVSRFPSENPAWHHSRYEEPRYMQRRTEKSYNDLPNPNFHQRGSHFQDFKRDTSSSNRRSGYGGYNNFPVR